MPLFLRIWCRRRVMAIAPCLWSAMIVLVTIIISVSDSNNIYHEKIITKGGGRRKRPSSSISSLSSSSSSSWSSKRSGGGFYAVFGGFDFDRNEVFNGVLLEWSRCSEHVLGVRNARYKRFNKAGDAIDFVNNLMQHQHQGQPRQYPKILRYYRKDAGVDAGRDAGGAGGDGVGDKCIGLRILGHLQPAQHDYQDITNEKEDAVRLLNSMRTPTTRSTESAAPEQTHPIGGCASDGDPCSRPIATKKKKSKRAITHEKENHRTTTIEEEEEQGKTTTSGIVRPLLVYTDGACENNGKPTARAGFGVWFGEDGPPPISSPLEGPIQTNQRAEMTAVIAALEVLLEKEAALLDRSTSPLDQDPSSSWSSPKKMKSTSSSKSRMGDRDTMKKKENSRKKPTQAPPVVIFSDSKYTINGVESWMPNWKSNNWRTSNDKPVKNKDLWMLLDSRLQGLRSKRNVELRYVKGHSGVLGNEMADKLAVQGIKRR